MIAGWIKRITGTARLRKYPGRDAVEVAVDDSGILKILSPVGGEMQAVDTLHDQTVAGAKTFSGTNVHSGGNTFSGAVTFSGATAGVRGAYSAAADSTGVTAAASGTTYINTKGSGSTVFTLPATVAGLTYTFIESDAGGEITVRPVAADKFMGKGITAADDKDYVNTGGSNAVGDLITIVGDGADGWWVVAERGTWAREA
jgi:hypothetical protein